jgi:excisionase family DNA binding protein
MKYHFKGRAMDTMHDNSDKVMYGPMTQLFDKKIWRINDVALFLQCSVKTIYNKTSKGEIPHIKKGKTLYFRPEEIENWVLEGNV